MRCSALRVGSLVQGTWEKQDVRPKFKGLFLKVSSSESRLDDLIGLGLG